jgi:hypothetical protein
MMPEFGDWPDSPEDKIAERADGDDGWGNLAVAQPDWPARTLGSLAVSQADLSSAEDPSADDSVVINDGIAARLRRDENGDGWAASEAAPQAGRWIAASRSVAVDRHGTAGETGELDDEDAESPDAAERRREQQESLAVRDTQDGWMLDERGAGDADGSSARRDLPTEGVIYFHTAQGAPESSAFASRRERAEEEAARASHLTDARQAVSAAFEDETWSDVPLQTLGPLPLDDEVIADRTTDNRVNLADDVRAVDLKPTYDGYLDVVMHGDATGTEAHIHGEIRQFSLEETAQLVEQTSGWDHRPIRLLSCSTGQDTYAQELAYRLDVPVYAPSDLLAVRPDGTTYIKNGGAWRRFEPRG